MHKNPIRRSQLVAPFGVGAMTVGQGGIGLLTAGLDHWYEREDGIYGIDVDEYKIKEWRLERVLQVDHFRLPPDYRESWRYGDKTPNLELTVPFLRFPQWHFCPWCDLLDERPLAEKGRPKCPDCDKDLYQVPFVAMCEQGHLQDFPWREWVHHAINPTCKGKLRIKSTGSATLSGQKVKCDKCGAVRNLSLVTTANPDGSTYLSNNLTSDDSIFYCQGKLPWLGDNAEEVCQLHLRGSLRSAANVYFAHVRSSIYLPQGKHNIPDELITIVATPPISTLVKTVIGALGGVEDECNIKKAVDQIIKGPYGPKFDLYEKRQIIEAVEIVFDVSNSDENIVHTGTSENTPVKFRYEEYIVLRENVDEELLKIKTSPLAEYEKDIEKYFSKIMLIDKLKETRVLTGFSRVFAENGQSLEDRILMLRKDKSLSNEWLPAYEVYGEGIFFEFNHELLSNWERKKDIINRIQRLNINYRSIQQNRHFRELEITPRFVLIHTFSHVLMNRLTYECGYSSAALKERLYVSNNEDNLMSGVLIYTADGDAEGTLGGLVRMGKPGYLESVILRALVDATWCSVDPVCTEIGGKSGQGPDSCNLAACHNCALVPETACEQFNRFLDRVTLVGDFDKPGNGYFQIS